MAHPKEPVPVPRRAFLRGAIVAGAVVPGMGALLAACTADQAAPSASASGPPSTDVTVTEIPYARPEHPVKLPLFDDNPAVASDAQPEAADVLRVYNWRAYLGPAPIKAFEQRYGVPVQYDGFDSMNEMTSALRAGQGYDLVFPTIDVLRDLVAEQILQPINADLIPNLGTSVWRGLRSPFYDVGPRYTVPYAMWTDGIAWRRDHVHEDISTADNPYDVLWTGDYRGHTAVLSEPRDALAFAMARRGVHDVNTDDASIITRAGDDLHELAVQEDAAFNHLKIDGLDGVYWLRESWSGTVVFAPDYMQSSVAKEVSYWWPPLTDPSIPGVIGSDTMAIPRAAQSPVLAHRFMDEVLSPAIAEQNFRFTGYQPPIRGLDPDRLVSDGLVAPNLRAAVIREEDFHLGSQIAPLPPQTSAKWLAAYQRAAGSST